MKVRIEFESPRGRVAFRCGLALAAAALAVSVPLYASQVGTLITFSPGQTIKASDFNTNFTVLKVAIDDTDNKCGVLSNLTTTAQANLVAAVNEVNGKIVTGALTSVTHDTSLTGTGTASSALGVDLSVGTGLDGRYLKLTGGTVNGGVDFLGPTSFAPPSTTGGSSILTTGGASTGVNAGGQALIALGGANSGTSSGGPAIQATGGGSTGTSGNGGNGIEANGGSSTNGSPGLAAQFHGKIAVDGKINPTVGVLVTAVLNIIDSSNNGGTGLACRGSPGPSSGTGGIAGDLRGGAGGNATVSGGAGGDGGRGLLIAGGSGGAGLGTVPVDGTGGVGGDFAGGQGGGVNGNAGDGITTQGGFGLGTGSGGNGITASGGNATGSGSPGLAGLFKGNVQINGSISKGSGTFKIDHPLDPENKFLYHSFVESPDMKNVYDGVVVLGEKGEATVELPSYVEALNRDFRYQLTCIGGAAVVYVSKEIHENRFSIAGGKPGLKVSWLVTGIRQDAFANAHRVQVEVEKSPAEKGKLLYPVENGRPESDGIYWDSSQKAHALAAPRVASQPAATRPEMASRPAPATGSTRD
jgi:hypothetical protein